MRLRERRSFEMNKRDQIPQVVVKIVICDVQEHQGHVMGVVTGCTSMVQAMQAACCLEGNEKVRGYEAVKWSMGKNAVV